MILFIPDISGFTSFVKEVDVSHSKHIMKELLELMIKKGKDYFTLAEVEGDALFFYAEEKDFKASQLNALIQEMHTAFHEYLNLYRYRRVCNCGACTTASDLELKFVLHQGETELLEVNGVHKPFGADVILAHRFLKNSIEAKEYILWSEAFFQGNKASIAEGWGENAQAGKDQYDGEEVPFHFHLLKKAIPNETEALRFPQLEQSNSVRTEQYIEASRDDVYQYVIDFSKRLSWNKGLNDLTYDDPLNRLNSAHTCVINGRNVKIETTYSKSEGEEYIYVESTADLSLMKSLTSVFRVKEQGEGSLMCVEIYLSPKNILGKMMLPIFKKKLKQSMIENLASLNQQITEQIPA